METGDRDICDPETLCLGQLGQNSCLTNTSEYPHRMFPILDWNWWRKLEDMLDYSSGCLFTNVSSVVAFQGWWVLKSKLFAQESTCSKEILISTSLNHL